MVELCWEVLASAQGEKCLDVVALVQKSGRILDIRCHLKEEGFKVDKLTDSEVSILFFALNGILVMVDDKSSFQYVTLSIEELRNMSAVGYLLPPDEKSNTTNILKFNSLDVINKYLKEGRFHFIKLVPLEEPLERGTFIAKPTGMRNYPKALGHKFYSMLCLNNTHAFYTRLIYDNNVKIMAGGSVYEAKRISRIAKSSFMVTGYFKFFDICDKVVSVPIWSLEGYEKEPENSIVSALQNGVCKYKNSYVTTNHEILQRYYGVDYIRELETYSVRCRMALEELYANYSYKTMEHIQEYYDIREGRTLDGFAHYLQDEIKKGNSQGSNCIVARSLTPVGQIKTGHKSYYVTINLDSIKELEIVEDYTKLMPKVFTFTAISGTAGLKTVTIHSTEATAYEKAKKVFEDKYGKIARFVSLCDSIDWCLVKGKTVVRFSANQVADLTTELKKGYSQNFLNWFRVLSDILTVYNYNYNIFEPCAKYLFANKLSKKSKAENLDEITVSECLIDLIELMTDSEAAQKELETAYTDIAYKSAYKLWKYYNESPKRVQEAIKTENGLISTDFADFKVDKTGDKLSSKVRLKFKGQYLGVKCFKEEEPYKAFK